MKKSFDWHLGHFDETGFAENNILCLCPLAMKSFFLYKQMLLFYELKHCKFVEHLKIKRADGVLELVAADRPPKS